MSSQSACSEYTALYLPKIVEKFDELEDNDLRLIPIFEVPYIHTYIHTYIHSLLIPYIHTYHHCLGSVFSVVGVEAKSFIGNLPISVCMYARTYVCKYVCTYACMYACIYICMYVCNKTIYCMYVCV